MAVARLGGGGGGEVQFDSLLLRADKKHLGFGGSLWLIH